jgi:hypothetical protein
LEVGQVPRADEDVAGGLQPVLGERALQPAHDRPADAHVGVAPVIGVLRVPGPLVGDADAADEAGAAVDDAELAMCAVVQAADRVGLGRAEDREVRARVAHLAGELAAHLRATDGVEQDVDLDPRSGSFAHRVGDLAGHLAVPVDVRQEVHRLLGAGDRLDERGEDLVAVDEDLGAVARRDRRARDRLGRALEGGGADLEVLAVQLVAVALLAPVAQRLAGVPGDGDRGDRGGPALVHAHPTTT